MSTMGRTLAGMPRREVSGASSAASAVHGARGAQHPQGHDHRHQRGDDADGDLEALLRALHEDRVHLHLACEGVERDAGHEQRDGPDRERRRARPLSTGRPRGGGAEEPAERPGRRDGGDGGAGRGEQRRAEDVGGLAGPGGGPQRDDARRDELELAVLRAQKRAWASVAVPASGFSRSSSSMALIPNGVAALPRPSMLAAMFMVIAPMAGESGGTDGKRRRSTGRASRPSARTSPASSATFMSPSQRVRTPTRPRERVTARPADSAMAPGKRRHAAGDGRHHDRGDEEQHPDDAHRRGSETRRGGNCQFLLEVRGP